MMDPATCKVLQTLLGLDDLVESTSTDDSARSTDFHSSRISRRIHTVRAFDERSTSHTVRTCCVSSLCSVVHASRAWSFDAWIAATVF
jgi:hypothetical protein